MIVNVCSFGGTHFDETQNYFFEKGIICLPGKLYHQITFPFSRPHLKFCFEIFRDYTFVLDITLFVLRKTPRVIIIEVFSFFSLSIKIEQGMRVCFDRG